MTKPVFFDKFLHTICLKLESVLLCQVKTMPMPKLSKQRDLTAEEKLELLKEYDKLQPASQSDAAAQLKISQPLLCKLLKNRQKNICHQWKCSTKEEEVQER